MRRIRENSSLHPEIRRLNRQELDRFVDDHLAGMSESEALTVLTNRFCSIHSCGEIAQTRALTSYYSVQRALVANRKTPQGFSLKFIPYLYWRDLLQLSTDVRVLPPVRRGIENQLRSMLRKLTVGERMTLARLCGRELVPDFMGDDEAKVFDCVLVNPRLSEETAVRWIETEEATEGQLEAFSKHPKWRDRYAVRIALVSNGKTPKSIAASQLKYLNQRDLLTIVDRESTSLYLRNCIERLGLLQGNGGHAPSREGVKRS